MGIYESLEYCLCYEEEKKEQYTLMQLKKQAQQLSGQNSGNETLNAGESDRLLSGDYEEIPMETFETNSQSQSSNSLPYTHERSILYNDTRAGQSSVENHVLPTPIETLYSPILQEEIELSEADSLLKR